MKGKYERWLALLEVVYRSCKRVIERLVIDGGSSTTRWSIFSVSRQVNLSMNTTRKEEQKQQQDIMVVLSMMPSGGDVSVFLFTPSATTFIKQQIYALSHKKEGDGKQSRKCESVKKNALRERN